MRNKPIVTLPGNTSRSTTSRTILDRMLNNHQIRMEVIATNRPKPISVEQPLAHIIRLRMLFKPLHRLISMQSKNNAIQPMQTDGDKEPQWVVVTSHHLSTNTNETPPMQGTTTHTNHTPKIFFCKPSSLVHPKPFQHHPHPTPSSQR